MSSLRSASDTMGRAALAPADIIRSGLCIGCGACVAQCAGETAEMRLDIYGQMKPAGARSWLNRRTMPLAASCPFSPDAEDEDALAGRHFPEACGRDPLIGRYEAAYVGHAEEGEFRGEGSSGGLVTWVAAELLRRGLIDGIAHVAPSSTDGDGGPLFAYTISRSVEALRQGAKSRYYPVELSGVLRTIRSVPGRYAVIGIPCFIKAVRLATAQDPVLAERIAFTLGLFCGHMKSARMAESFAWQMGTAMEDVAALDYRVKSPDRPANWYRAQVMLNDGTTREKDWWHMVDGDWGAGFFQNHACNFCDDVVGETADISFGDAWVEPYSSDGRGTNVVIVRSRELHGIVGDGVAAGRIALEPVDAGFVAATQAAGFRHRREGLAFRLTWWRAGLTPRKRVQASADGISARRRMTYRMRYGIARWSHRVFLVARLLRWRRFYLMWATAALSTYHGLAYSRGPVGRLVERLGLAGAEDGH